MIAQAEKMAIEADKQALDYTEQEKGVTHERDMEKLGAQAQANIALEDRKQFHKQNENAQKMQAELQKNLLKNYVEKSRTTPPNSQS